jgi:multidrug resistance efflux pump
MLIYLCIPGVFIGTSLIAILYLRGLGYDRDNPESRELIADVNPTFNWVRLAQRVPVRIHIDEVPEGVLLAAGITCTVIVDQTQN